MKDKLFNAIFTLVMAFAAVVIVFDTVEENRQYAAAHPSESTQVASAISRPAPHPFTLQIGATIMLFSLK